VSRCFRICTCRRGHQKTSERQDGESDSKEPTDASVGARHLLAHFRTYRNGLRPPRGGFRPPSASRYVNRLMRALDDGRNDDPELASYLRIEERELEAGGLN
jgi:hypothetical protein